MSALPPKDAPANPPGGLAVYPTRESEGRPVSFYLAIFLGMLLVLSAGLNLVLLFVGVMRNAVDSLGSFEVDDGSFQLVAVGGDADARDKILRVPISGAIAEGASPLLGAAGGTVSQVERALKLARRDDTVRGVLLYVDSPGGGVTDSDLIYRKLREFRAETQKPVVALFGDIAASGGYYIACACDHIMAQETTITGSIGVILSQWNYAEAMQKLGIESVDIVSARTPRKAMLSGAKPVDENELAIARSIVDEMYDRFVEVVAQGRPDLDRDRIVTLADGRIYSARQAKEHGLVDGIGTERDAVAMLKTRAKASSVKIVEQRRRIGLLDMFGGAHAASPPPSLEQALGQFLTQSTGPRLLYFWPGGR